MEFCPYIQQLNDILKDYEVVDDDNSYIQNLFNFLKNID